MDSPQVVVIAGPNGSGKSTAAPVLLHELFGISQYVNADTIAAGLAGNDPDSVALQAGKLMLRRLRELAEKRESFAFETTLASRSFAPWLKELRNSGYQIHLIFLSLGSDEVAISRVADRVAMGGHAIPEEVIRRRFQSGIENLWSLYWPILDQVFIYDNTAPGSPDLVAYRGADGRLMVEDSRTWDHLNEYRND